jgi:hypothetical protein
VRLRSIHERRQLRALVGDEHRDQFRRLGGAGVGRDQMHGAGRLEERLAHLECFNRTAGQLRTDFALGDVGGDGAGIAVRRTASLCSPMAVRTGKAAGAIEHAHDGDALARHVRQRIRADRLDDVLGRTRRIAART